MQETHTEGIKHDRARFSSRLGFVIVSVSCAIGLGNVWLMPYRAGVMGGGLYVIMVAFFAITLGIPVLMTEYAVGRGSQRSISQHYHILQPKGTKWHIASYMGIAGNYFLLMFYMVVCGFTLAYLLRGITGELIGATPDEVSVAFASLTSSPIQTVGFMAVSVVFSFLACIGGLKKGVEFFSKYLTLMFFALILVLILRALTLPGAIEGLAFAFVPNLEAVAEHGIFNIVHTAMGQALFSLSVGIGSMAVFGSYLGKERSLVNEARTVGLLDLSGTLLCLIMIFPAAFAFDISPQVGPGLIFVTLPNVFNQMPLPYVWSLMFYIGLAAVSFSTAIAVCENVVSICIDRFGWGRKKSVLINMLFIITLCLPAALGFNVLAHITIPGGNLPNFTISGFWTYLVMENILPLGAIVYLGFATRKNGWGWNNFLAEVNSGSGQKLSSAMRLYMTYVVPLAILFIFAFGHINRWVL